MRRLALLLPLALAGCPSVPEDAARAAVRQAFEAANPPGRTGIEVTGKAVWLTAPFFEEECLHEKDLAFSDSAAKRPKGARGPRISPTYENQRYITGFTEKGWCVYLGDDPTLDLRAGEWTEGRWEFMAILGMREPTPWFECLSYDATHRVLTVGKGPDGQPQVGGGVALADDACPHPLPGGEPRRAGVRPSTAAPGAPTLVEVRDLLMAFDQSLWERDFEKALGLVSCYNVFEKQPYGACSVAELINLGPMPRGTARIEDGAPWTLNALGSLDDLKRVFPDAQDESLFHVAFEPVRGDQQRTLAVQWVAGAWKLVGVVGLKAEDITTMRVVYDLDRKERREIFERRMKGEAIDERGDPYDPYAETREE